MKKQTKGPSGGNKDGLNLIIILKSPSSKISSQRVANLYKYMSVINQNLHRFLQIIMTI